MHAGPGKYFGTQQDLSGNTLMWPGTLDGYPVRGPASPVPLREEELDELPYVSDFHAEILTLPADLERYIYVMDRVVNGFWVKDREEFHYHPEDRTYSVFLSWAEVSKQVPANGTGK